MVTLTLLTCKLVTALCAAKLQLMPVDLQFTTAVLPNLYSTTSTIIQSSSSTTINLAHSLELAPALPTHVVISTTKHPSAPPLLASYRHALMV